MSTFVRLPTTVTAPDATNDPNAVPLRPVTTEWTPAPRSLRQATTNTPDTANRVGLAAPVHDVTAANP